MKKILILLLCGLVGCVSTIQASDSHIISCCKTKTDKELSYVCSNNAILAKHTIARVTSSTTIDDLLNWIKIDQHAWSEMAYELYK